MVTNSFIVVEYFPFDISRQDFSYLKTSNGQYLIFNKK